MPLDGCFIHYLVDELNNEVLSYKVNKITQPSPLDVILQLRGKNEVGLIVNKQLLLSSRLDTPRIHITNEKYQNPETPLSFCMLLRKYLDRGVITSISQYQNDRIIEITISSTSEMLDEIEYKLIIELMGRNSNIILVNKDSIILDAIRKLPPSFDNLRTIIPKAVYSYPPSNITTNPFLDYSSCNKYQGVSKQLSNALQGKTSDELTTFLNQDIHPVIYSIDSKKDFYAYQLDKEDIVISSHSSLSDMLECFYKEVVNVTNFDTKMLEKVIKKDIKKCVSKLDNLEIDLEEAKKNIHYSDFGILLQANMYRVKKGDKSVEVTNFLSNNEAITIPLNPLYDPSKNLKKIFQIAKKAKIALVEVNKQIELVLDELSYLENILFQLSISNNEEIEDIKVELINNGYIQDKRKKKTVKSKVSITCYKVDNAKIYVGKNNVQNDYLTHQVARKNDLWFHTKDIPGSHVVIKVQDDTDINELVIRAAAKIAAYYSKARSSSSVPVDYTRVSNLKKIPKVKGSKVLLTNQKTIYIDPSIEFINSLEKIN